MAQKSLRTFLKGMAMSNFTFQTCGLTNIDCGKAGYKTAREIELEKKLEIAVKALEICLRTYPMCNLTIIKQALAEIKEIKE